MVAEGAKPQQHSSVRADTYYVFFPLFGPITVRVTWAKTIGDNIRFLVEHLVLKVKSSQHDSMKYFRNLPIVADEIFFSLSILLGHATCLYGLREKTYLLTISKGYEICRIGPDVKC